MTTTTNREASAPATQIPGFVWPGMGDRPWVSSVPWELATQALALQSTLWMAAATLQARWLSEGAEALARMPSWMIWHNGTEQLA